MAKGNGDSKFVTQGMLMEAVDAILAGVENMHKNSDAKNEMRFQSIEKRMGGLEKRMGGFEKRMGGFEKRMGGFEKRMNKRHDETQEKIESLDEKIDVNYRNVNGKIKAMKATSVSREEFEELRDEVKRLKKSFASG